METRPLSKPYHEWRALAITTLTAVATLIGSAILALPVTLYRTSLPIFMVFFTITMLIQVTNVSAIVELFQRQLLDAPPAPSDPSTAPTSGPDYDTLLHEPDRPRVSLFDIANLYLPNIALRYVYYIATLLCFVSIMVSYGLAGTQAIWQLFGSDVLQTAPPQYMFVLYWFVGSFLVIFFMDRLLGVFSSFTVLKGVLFAGVVLIVYLLPDAARVAHMPDLFSEFSGWNRATTPFLMSCVALVGVTNSMPVTFNLLPARPSHGQILRYRNAVLAGVLICYSLNVMWVIAVLQVVPRVAGPGKSSLTVAFEQGQISTIPLVETLHVGGAVRGGVLWAIEIIIEMFIVVSTGVCFFVSAASMKSFLDGAADAAGGRRIEWLKERRIGWVVRAGVYTGAFGVVLGIIVENPKGFIDVLTRLSSLTVNVQSGILVFVMLYFARKRGTRGGYESLEEGTDMEIGKNEERAIALELGRTATWAYIVVGGIFFTFAVGVGMFGPLLEA